MYSKQERSRIRKNFWTSFGQYMRPIPNAEGELINWVNYKTGIRHIYFRMDADNKQAAIGIEIRHPDPLKQQDYFRQFTQTRTILQEMLGEEWHWLSSTPDEDGHLISRIYTTLPHVNIFDQQDWSAIISFLKPRIIALDEYWNLVRHGFSE